MSLNLTADFGSVIDGLAVADAYAAFDKNAAYWNAIIGYAFDRADAHFNALAASTAATGAIKHMFEWGTTGINRQATNMRPRPTEERARLWKTILVDSGPRTGASVFFEFKPSVADVPVATTVPAEIRAKMRKHQFKWKARVMELDEPVHISRQDAQFLLIPASSNLTGFRPYDIKRGYTLTKKDITAYPGARTHGNFSAYWERYWANKGPENMSEIILSEIEKDFVPLMAASNRAKSMVMPASVVESVKARSKAFQAEVAANAIRRRRNTK